MGRVVIIAPMLLVTAACPFRAPTLEDGMSDDGASPPDSRHADAAPDDALPPTDDAGSPAADAPLAAIVIEAESFSRGTPGTGNSWTLLMDDTGHSGGGYMQILPANGEYCPTVPSSCAASLQYDVTVVVPATYFFQVRMRAVNTAEDSLYYGLDGTPVMMPIDQMEDGTWKWETGTSFVLTPGPHTVDVWQREAGARIDVVALTPTATPP